MEDCIFCKIVKGELPSYKVYEDDLFLAILDIYPNVKGHTIIIPKEHYQWVYEVPEFEKYWGVALKITKAMQEVLNPSWVNYYTYGAIPHAHIHVLPRTGKPAAHENAVAPGGASVTKEEFITIKDQLSSAVKD